MTVSTVQGTFLQGVGLSDGDCGVVEVVVGEVTSSGRGEGDGLWVVVEGGCEDDGVGCEVWDGGMVVDILVGYPSSPGQTGQQMPGRCTGSTHSAKHDFTKQRVSP